MKYLILLCTLTFLSSCFKTEISSNALPTNHEGISFELEKNIYFATIPGGGDFAYFDADTFSYVPTQYTYSPASMGYTIPIDACLKKISLEYQKVAAQTSTFNVLVNNNYTHDSNALTSSNMSGKISTNANYYVYKGDTLIMEFNSGSSHTVYDNYDVTVSFGPCN